MLSLPFRLTLSILCGLLLAGWLALIRPAQATSVGNPIRAVAVGAHYYDFGSTAGTDLGDVLSLYATGSYEVRRQGDTTSFARPFLGVEALVSPDFSIGADFLTKHGDAAQAYTLSARYQPVNKSLAAQIGIGKLRNDTKFFVGLTYAFGR